MKFEEFVYFIGKGLYCFEGNFYVDFVFWVDWVVIIYGYVDYVCVGYRYVLVI